jgi:hypothetical protein
MESKIKTVKSQAEFEAIRPQFVQTETWNPVTKRWETTNPQPIREGSKGMAIPPRSSK